MQLEQLSNMLLKYSNYSKCQKQPSEPEKEMPSFCICVGFVMIMLRVGGLLIGRQAGGAAGWDQGQVTEHRTANGNPLFLLASFATSTRCMYVQNMSLLHIDVFELCLE